MQPPYCAPLAALVIACCFAASAAAEDWPRFRGPDSSGIAPAGAWPLDWQQRAWTVQLPGRGPSSPIVVRNCVIVTCSSGVQQERLHVLCFAADDGELLWERQFWATGRTFCHSTSAVAAPTPASDGEQIYAFYSSNDLICLDLDGNLKWFRGLAYDYPQAGNDAGMSSSPLVVDGTVVVQIENQGDSFAAGIDTATGETRWRMDRKREGSWSSPILVRDPVTGNNLVLLQSVSQLTAHDPATGKEAWQYDAGCDGIASAVAAEDCVFVPSAGITALEIDSSRKPKVLWQNNRFAPASASPVVAGGRIYTLNRAGVLACGDAARGELLWQLRLAGRFWATPIVAGDYVFTINSDGLAHVVQLGEKGKIVATADFGETIQGTPAAADGAFYVRSDRHLWKIAPPPPAQQGE